VPRIAISEAQIDQMIRIVIKAARDAARAQGTCLKRSQVEYLIPTVVEATVRALLEHDCRFDLYSKSTRH
jgi:hypothetical protein